MELGENLDFDSTRGLYFVSETHKTCIASAEGFVTPLFVIALQGKLYELSEQIMHTKEWQRIPVNTTFISYVQLCHYIALSEHEAVNKAMPEGQREALDKLTRAYLNWVIECEDKIVAEKPSVWFEPAFYPAGVKDPTGGDDLYNQYDAIPFGGFARTAFYFFIANTAKDAIREAVQGEDLLEASKKAIALCKAIFEDRDNVVLNRGMFRRLLEEYLKWQDRQKELELAEDVTLTKEDIWQVVYDGEAKSYQLFKDNIGRCKLEQLRSLLNLQGDFLKRMQKEHPSIKPMEQEQRTLESTFTYLYQKNQAYPLLIDFLRKEKGKTGRSADSDWARHALVLYEWTPTVLADRPNTFTEWLHEFCALFGRAWVRDYEPNKLRTQKKSKVESYMP